MDGRRGCFNKQVQTATQETISASKRQDGGGTCSQQDSPSGCSEGTTGATGAPAQGSALALAHRGRSKARRASVNRSHAASALGAPLRQQELLLQVSLHQDGTTI
jgi:hypothetical protein